MTIQELDQACNEAIGKLAIAKEQFPFFIQTFKSIPTIYVYYYPVTAMIIMAVKTREDFALVWALHKGTWKKFPPNFDETNSVEVRYDATIRGVDIVVYVHELPPSCVIVDETVHVPTVYEHDEIRRTISCPKTPAPDQNPQFL